MPGFIRAIVSATLFQVVVMTGLIVFMGNHADNITQQYARITLESAKSYTDQRNLDLYNRLQQERNADRLDMQLFLEKQITLQLLKRNHE
jgi:hypothetical protein